MLNKRIAARPIVAPLLQLTRQATRPRGIYLISSTTTAVMVTGRHGGGQTECAAAGGGDDCAEPAAVWHGASPTKRAVTPGSALATAGLPQASAGLRAPSVRPRTVRAPLFFDRLAADRGQPSMGHHRERDMPVPTVPVTHLVLIEPPSRPCLPQYTARRCNGWRPPGPT